MALAADVSSAVPQRWARAAPAPREYLESLALGAEKDLIGDELFNEEGRSKGGKQGKARVAAAGDAAGSVAALEEGATVLDAAAAAVIAASSSSSPSRSTVSGRKRRWEDTYRVVPDLEYRELEFEASLMPSAGDLEVERRVMISVSAQRFLPDELSASEPISVTRPVVAGSEAAVVRFLFLPRSAREMAIEARYRASHQSWWDRLRGRALPTVNRLECVQLAPGVAPFQRLVVPFDRRGRCFARLGEEEDEAASLAAALRRLSLKPAALKRIVAERLDPIPRRMLPGRWAPALVAVSWAALAGASTALVVLALGVQAADLTVLTLRAWAALCGAGACTVLLLATHLRLYRRFRRRRWRRCVAALQAEITAVNDALAALEVRGGTVSQSGQGGAAAAGAPAGAGASAGAARTVASATAARPGVELRLCTFQEGRDPYSDERAAKLLLQQCDAHRKLARNLAKAKALAQSNAVPMQSKAQARAHAKQVRALAQILAERTLLARSGAELGALELIKHLAVHIREPPIEPQHHDLEPGLQREPGPELQRELSPPRRGSDGLPPRERAATEESRTAVRLVDSPEAVSASADSAAAAEAAQLYTCARCTKIERFAREIGLQTLAEALCKSAQVDHGEYEQYLAKKLGAPELAAASAQTSSGSAPGTAPRKPVCNVCGAC
jgi:hypothetical protein